MEIVDLKTSDIIPYENNPRINDKAVKGGHEQYSRLRIQKSDYC